MSQLSEFSGSEEDFKSTVLSWHHEMCGLPFYQWKQTNWMLCDAGHTYHKYAGQFWCRKNMGTHVR